MVSSTPVSLKFENAMNRLAPGVISEPTVTRFGVHLILVEERRDAKVALSELREQARNVLREKKLDENFNIWLMNRKNFMLNSVSFTVKIIKYHFDNSAEYHTS
ncbi:MAG: peptidylprolyl isomerase [Polaromonas sp.]|nr:peptidylprolyl isomerase [Polaromonas sp.]